MTEGGGCIVAARRPVIQARLGVALTFGFGSGFGRNLFVLGHRSCFSCRSGLDSRGCFNSRGFFSNRSRSFFNQRRFGDGVYGCAQIFAAIGASLLAATGRCLSDRIAVQADGARSVIIGRNREGDAVGRDV